MPFDKECDWLELAASKLLQNSKAASRASLTEIPPRSCEEGGYDWLIARIQNSKNSVMFLDPELECGSPSRREVGPCQEIDS